MSRNKAMLWEVEPHTLAKHEILKRYLGAWFPILGKYNERIIYLDGFCGPGRYKNGEDGSPIIALNQAMNHSTRFQGREIIFIFIDNRNDRIEHLKSELAKVNIPSNYTVKPISSDFASVIGELLDDLDSKSENLAPTFAFIDPFGFKGVHFSIVRRLLNNPKTEVLINVMVDWINRFLDHPDSETQRHIVELFGTNDVLNVINGGGDRVTALRLLYQQQLSKYARYVRYFEMLDDRDRIIYYLFFATNNNLGHVKMKEAFWKVDKSSGYKFSDKTDPNQLVLFELDPTAGLGNDLSEQFKDLKVKVGEVRAFVEEKTPFTSFHARKVLKMLEEKNLIIVDPTKADETKRIRGTFPDTVIVDFRQAHK